MKKTVDLNPAAEHLKVMRSMISDLQDSGSGAVVMSMNVVEVCGRLFEFSRKFRCLDQRTVFVGREHLAYFISMLNLLNSLAETYKFRMLLDRMERSGVDGCRFKIMDDKGLKLVEEDE